MYKLNAHIICYFDVNWPEMANIFNKINPTTVNLVVLKLPNKHNIWISNGKGTNKFLPRTGHEGTEGE
jgi:hypothetical protein